MSEETDNFKKKREDQRQALAGVQLDGPHFFNTGFDAMGMFAQRNKFAICLRCGSLVVLNDPETSPEGWEIERSVRIHLEWHEEIAGSR